MPDTDISLQLLQLLRRKGFVYQSHILTGKHPSLGTLCIAYRNTAAFLTPVLQRQKSVINGGRYITAIKIVNAKYTTFFF